MLILAQCATDDCALANGLPWYFGLVIGALWLTAVVGVALLARRVLLRGLTGRRLPARLPVGTEGEPPAWATALGPGPPSPIALPDATAPGDREDAGTTDQP